MPMSEQSACIVGGWTTPASTALTSQSSDNRGTPIVRSVVILSPMLRKHGIKMTLLSPKMSGQTSERSKSHVAMKKVSRKGRPASARKMLLRGRLGTDTKSRSNVVALPIAEEAGTA